jgi:hypothetical protein
MPHHCTNFHRSSGCSAIALLLLLLPVELFVKHGRAYKESPEMQAGMWLDAVKQYIHNNTSLHF